MWPNRVRYTRSIIVHLSRNQLGEMCCNYGPNGQIAQIYAEESTGARCRLVAKPRAEKGGPGHEPLVFLQGLLGIAEHYREGLGYFGAHTYPLFMMHVSGFFP